MLTAIDRWRPEGGAAFLTYALQWIRSYVRGEWLRELSGGFVGVQLAFRRQREDLPVRVDCDWILASPAPDPLDQVIGSEAAEVLERIMAIAGLQERDREILRRHESGETFGAIGADWGLSREGARLREGQARTRLMLASRSIDPCYTSP